jgi:hypothetical protein
VAERIKSIMNPQDSTLNTPPSAIQSEISVASKNVQALNSRVNLANNLYIGFLVATLISTILIVRWNGKMNAAKDDLQRANDRKVAGDLKEKDEQISKTNERAAKLEKEAADARLELEKLKQRITEEVKNAPLKARVSTASASVKLMVGPAVAKSFKNPKRSSDGTIASLEIGKSTNWVIRGTEIVGNGPWTLFLASDHAEEWGNVAGSEIFLQFTTRSFAPVDLEESVEELLKSVDMVSFSLDSIPSGSEILSGTITLTLNGNVKKTFPIPAYHTDWTGLQFLVPTGSAPIILTNKPVEIK